MLETASIASGATVALLLVIIICIIFCIRWHKRQKQERLALDESSNMNGVDTVDGVIRQDQRRPFGPHHYHTISMCDALKR